MQCFSTTDLADHPIELTEAASREPVVITDQRRSRFVLMSIEAYNQIAPEKLADTRIAFTLETMPHEIEDALIGLADHYERQATSGI